MTTARCLALTADSADIIAMMLAAFRPGRADPRLAEAEPPAAGA
jgi:hypothetical protein